MQRSCCKGLTDTRNGNLSLYGVCECQQQVKLRMHVSTVRRRQQKAHFGGTFTEPSLS